MEIKQNYHLQLSKQLQKCNLNFAKLKIAIILPYFNENLGLELLKNAKKELLKNGILEKNILTVRTAGALEIPLACQKIIKNKKVSAVIALGIIIQGETNHYELVCQNTYQGLMAVQLKTDIPIAFGVLTCKNYQQAKKRLNKGRQAALTALIQLTI